MSKHGMFDRLTYNYSETTNKNTKLFSLLPPEEIADQLISKLIENDIVPEIYEKKWKLTFTITRDLTDQEREFHVQPMFCKVQVRLCKVA
jgi:hypothetical protein